MLSGLASVQTIPQNTQLLEFLLLSSRSVGLGVKPRMAVSSFHVAFFRRHWCPWRQPVGDRCWLHPGIRSQRWIAEPIHRDGRCHEVAPLFWHRGTCRPWWTGLAWDLAMSATGEACLGLQQACVGLPVFHSIPKLASESATVDRLCCWCPPDSPGKECCRTKAIRSASWSVGTNHWCCCWKRSETTVAGFAHFQPTAWHCRLQFGPVGWSILCWRCSRCSWPLFPSVGWCCRWSQRAWNAGSSPLPDVVPRRGTPCWQVLPKASCEATLCQSREGVDLLWWLQVMDVGHHQSWCCIPPLLWPSTASFGPVGLPSHWGLLGRNGCCHPVLPLGLRTLAFPRWHCWRQGVSGSNLCWPQLVGPGPYWRPASTACLRNPLRMSEVAVWLSCWTFKWLRTPTSFKLLSTERCPFCLFWNFTCCLWQKRHSRPQSCWAQNMSRRNAKKEVSYWYTPCWSKVEEL